jgi:3-hydroxyisobutyrate dehydrogenase-like beta-hydroxyacid dehydrogenase
MTGGVGLIGLGNMGLALGGRLALRFRVLGHDLRAERVAMAEAAGVVPATLAEIAGQAATVVLSLPSPAASHAVVAELLGSLPPGAMVVETSTVTPDDARRLHANCGAAGVGFVDAAVLSGVEIMARGESALLIGATPEGLARARPVLDALAARQTVMGPPGAGMAAKVVNNAVAHAVYVVLAEAVAMARGAGISIEDTVALLRGADSGLMRPLTHRIGERLAQHDFAGGMRMDAARKDSALALEMAQGQGLPLFAIQAAHSVYEIACAQGMAAQDYAALATLWEAWANR